MPKSQPKPGVPEANSGEPPAIDGRTKFRAQRTAERDRRFTIQMQKLARELDRLKQTIDAQIDSLAEDDASERSSG